MITQTIEWFKPEEKLPDFCDECLVILGNKCSYPGIYYNEQYDDSDTIPDGEPRFVIYFDGLEKIKSINQILYWAPMPMLNDIHFENTKERFY